jgi:hypothetical protein
MAECGFWRFLRNGFPFEYTRHTNINPLLRNIQAELLCFLSNEIVATEYTTMKECVLYLVRIYLLKEVDLDS